MDRIRCLLLLATLASVATGFLIAPSQVATTRTVVALWASEDTPEVRDVFTEKLAKQLAGEVQKAVNIPFIPRPVVEYIMTEAIKDLSTEVSRDTLGKVRELLAAASTKTKFDDFPAEDRDALAMQVASELNSKIDVPVLDEEQELQVLQEVFKVVFACLATSNATMRKELIKGSVEASKDLLGSDESRDALTKRLNEMVDIPLLDENQEEEILKKAVASSSQTLQTLIPPEFIETLQGQRPEALFETKVFLVEKLNEKVDIVGLNEEQESALLTAMVDIIVDNYVTGTDMEFMMLPQEQQQESLEEKYEFLKREKELSTERHEREQKNLDAKLERLEGKLKKMKKRGGIFRLFRRSK